MGREELKKVRLDKFCEEVVVRRECKWKVEEVELRESWVFLFFVVFYNIWKIMVCLYGGRNKNYREEKEKNVFVCFWIMEKDCGLYYSKRDLDRSLDGLFMEEMERKSMRECTLIVVRVILGVVFWLF